MLVDLLRTALVVAVCVVSAGVPIAAYALMAWIRDSRRVGR